MSFVLRLGAKLPNLDCKSTKGDFKLHEFLGGDKECPWTILFTHPKDYTPVCTTELGECEKLVGDFSKMGVKLIGVSCDSVEEHNGWSKDVLAKAGITGKDSLSFPIIADADRSIVTELSMLDPNEKDAAGVPLPARALVVIGPDMTVKLSILYPATTGRNFEEVKRVVKSLQMTANHKLATPVNWKDNERVICAPALTTDDAKAQFKNFKQEDLPSGKPYLRYVDCPTVAN